MTMSFSRLLIVLLVTSMTVSVNGRQATRDSSIKPTRVRTAIVAGVVTLGDADESPVRRAVVTLTAEDGSETLAAISDESGRFSIGKVPAGRFTLGAAKAAHVSIPYGARRAGRRGTALVVKDGERLDGLTLVLPRGAVLAGRITLPDGRPMPNVPVLAILASQATGRGKLISGPREFRTDDLGEFRVFGLVPDTYVLAALPSFGRGEVQRMQEGAISEVIRQLGVGARSGPAIPTPDTLTYAPTYFPGTPSVGDALRIPLTFGQTRDGLSFSIAPVPSATIYGRVLGIDGTPTAAVVLSIESIGPALGAGGVLSQVGPPNHLGEFQVAGVSPGVYRLRARAGGGTLNAKGTLDSIRSDAQTQYAVGEVSVVGANVDGFELRLQEGRRFSGRLSVDHSAAKPVWTGASVIVEPRGYADSASPGVLSPGVSSREGKVDAAGQFTVAGLEPLEYTIRVNLPSTLLNAGWHVESIRSAEHDLRDEPLTFVAGSIEGVDVRLTTAVTELRGRLLTEDTPGPSAYFILIFPADRTLWHSASPRVRIVRPAADGTFRAQDMPAGLYRLAALTDISDDEPNLVELLGSVYELSVSAEVISGKTTHKEIRIGK